MLSEDERRVLAGWARRRKTAQALAMSAAWVDESTRAQVDTASTPEQYGYQWWVTTADGDPAFAAMGSGGQLVEVVPDLGLVVVVSSTAAVGNADTGLYLELVSEIAPAIGQ